jgi:hypothetical protein
VLQSDLAALGVAPAPVREPTTSLPNGPRTPADKVKLFRQLFRGRPDLYPTRFVSKKTGKPGYAPACSNKFVPGVCELPKVKCGDCTKQAFRPFDDAAVFAHLEGQHVMGVYAMLDDETCWFLAVDFDKSSWIEDVRAFVETARRLGLPAVVERSRSGNGAHVWFFFSAPVAASTARKMGCHPITETMARRHELSLDSYDRLFPSQDTMPRGGFGNLIALPLQHGPRQAGNSVFLDDDFVALPDDQQWAFLAMPVSWKGTLVQYTGRLHRLHPGKSEVRILDYADREVPMLVRMFEKRLRGYPAIGYARGEAPLGYAEPSDLPLLAAARRRPSPAAPRPRRKPFHQD